MSDSYFTLSGTQAAAREHFFFCTLNTEQGIREPSKRQDVRPCLGVAFLSEWFVGGKPIYVSELNPQAHQIWCMRVSFEGLGLEVRVKAQMDTIGERRHHLSE